MLQEKEKPPAETSGGAGGNTHVNVLDTPILPQVGAGRLSMNEPTYAVCMFDSGKDNVPKPREWSKSEAIQMLTTHCDRTTKDGAAFSPTIYRDGSTRGKDNVKALSLIPLDFDHGATLSEIEGQFVGIEHLTYSTYSHSEDSARLRVVIFPTRLMSAIEWPEVHGRLMAHFPGADPTCKDTSRLYYLPACQPGAPRYAEYHKGKPLDPDTLPPVPKKTPAVLPLGNINEPYLKAALAGELTELRLATEGLRNVQLNKASFACGSLIGAGMNEQEVCRQLEATSFTIGLTGKEVQGTIDSGIKAGKKKPREIPNTKPQPTLALTKPTAQAIPLEEPAIHALRSPYTDTGNAERFAKLYGQEAKYCYAWNKYLAWTRTHWEPDDMGQVSQLGKQALLTFYREAGEIDDPATRKQMVTWAQKSESERARTAMLKLAIAEPGISVKPEQFDKDPWLLNVLNGTIDLSTGILLPHRREDYITKLIPVNYDPDAQCPLWKNFLTQILDGNAAVYDFVKKVIGYSLTGSTREQDIFVLWGSGKNGKSTLLQIVLSLLGNYAIKIKAKSLMTTKGDRIDESKARMKGARVVVASESEEGHRLAEAMIKEMTGNETVTGELKFGHEFEYVPEAKLFLGTNHKPVIRGTDRAIWTRVKLIPFNVVFPEDRQDKGLLSKLQAELPGILAWAVEGCLEWQAEGLRVPKEVEKATASYQTEMDALADFLNERCILKVSEKVSVTELYATYKRWCEEGGEKTESQRSLCTRFTEKGFERKRGTHGVYFWQGIGLLGDTSNPDDEGTSPASLDDPNTENNPYDYSQVTLSGTETPSFLDDTTSRREESETAPPISLVSPNDAVGTKLGDQGQLEDNGNGYARRVIDLAELHNWPEEDLKPGVIGGSQEKWENFVKVNGSHHGELQKAIATLEAR